MSCTARSLPMVYRAVAFRALYHTTIIYSKGLKLQIIVDRRSYLSEELEFYLIVDCAL